ncbi:MAG TPA: hypothetical protein VGU25_05035 [Acidobacteriaceae bacterium]|nr:hypothetical protein [Acidobacteriaceae bacterium]
MQRIALPRFLALCALACLCIAGFSLKLLQYRFGGYDLSPLIDSGWRVYLGQVPNRDFICTFPPILYLAIALAFRILGARWLAITLAGTIFPLVLTIVGLRIIHLLRTHISETRLRWLALIYCALQMTPLLAIGFPWHSSWTETASLYALLATFALAISNTPRTELLTHLTLAETLLLLAKPNIALPILLGCTITLLLARRARAAILTLAGAALLSSLLLAFAHTSLVSTYRLYAQLTSRFQPGHFLDGILYNKDLSVGFQRWTIYAILLPGTLWIILQALRRTPTPIWLRAVALTGVIAAWLGIGTNVEFALVDAPVLLLGAALIATTRANIFARSAISAATYILFAIAGFYGISRARMQEIGVWAEAETCPTEAHIHDPFFGSFTTCRNLASILEETDSAIHTLTPRSVFFGPRMEFLYARYRLASPRGLPLWWHPGSAYPLPAEPAILAAFEADRPQLLIFLHDDRSHMPTALLDRMSREYRQLPHPPSPHYADLADDPTANIDIYTRR